MKRLRRSLHTFVPAHFHDPLGLSLRLIRSGNRCAYFAMGCALAGGFAAPIDFLLEKLERRRYQQATPRRLPLLFVCGPPRSGTTVVAQTLLAHLPLAYFNNLTSIFPRSPLLASSIFRRVLRQGRPDLNNFYGRTCGLSAPNDALFLWDRWLGPQRERIPDHLEPRAAGDMRQFFATCEQTFGRPLLNKCNRLNTLAHLVAETLENSYFICLTRNRQQLAQSLYRARLDIHGTATVPYGVTDPTETPAQRTDAAASVCRQVLFHEAVCQRQRERIPKQRFSVVSYEDFCRNPGRVVEQMRTRLLPDLPSVGGDLIEPLKKSNGPPTDADLSCRLEQAFVRLLDENPLTAAS